LLVHILEKLMQEVENVGPHLWLNHDPFDVAAELLDYFVGVLEIVEESTFEELPHRNNFPLRNQLIIYVVEFSEDLEEVLLGNVVVDYFAAP